MTKPIIRLDHVGYITSDPDRFERFWVQIVGFEKRHESVLTEEMAQQLFGLPGPAQIRRYFLGTDSIEIHVFPNSQIPPTPKEFSRFGLNHIALHLEDRDQFIRELPAGVKIHSFQNPGGWTNVFIEDFEGNYVELRYTMPAKKV